MGISKRFFKQPWVILALIVILGAALRLGQVNYPLDNPDFGRDFLISRHIAIFGEQTMQGPANPVLQTLKNSPLYYYLLAAVIRIWDSPLAPLLVNFVLQLSIIPLVFLTGRRLFGDRVGLVAAALMAANPLSITESAYFWQPYLMAWLISLAILVFTLAAPRKHSLLLLVSAWLLATSGTVNNAAFGLIPAFLTLVWVVTKNWARLLLATTVLGVTVGIYFLPNFLYVRGQAPAGFHPAESLVPGQFFSNLGVNFTALFSNFFNWGSFSALAGVALTLLVIWVYKRERNGVLLALAATIGSFIVLAAPLKLPWRPDYFTPLLTPLVLLISYTLTQLPHRFLSYALLTGLLIFPVSKFTLQTPLRDLPKVTTATTAVEQEIAKIQMQLGLPDRKFFRIIYYPGKLNGNIVLSYDAVFWAGLESDWQTKMTYLVSSDFGYRSSNGNDYLVLACREITGPDCLGQFQADQPSGKTEFIVGTGSFGEARSFYEKDGFNLYLLKRF